MMATEFALDLKIEDSWRSNKGHCPGFKEALPKRH
jgi:hypothetical protein